MQKGAKKNPDGTFSLPDQGSKSVPLTPSTAGNEALNKMMDILVDLSNRMDKLEEKTAVFQHVKNNVNDPGSVYIPVISNEVVKSVNNILDKVILYIS